MAIYQGGWNELFSYFIFKLGDGTKINSGMINGMGSGP